MNGPGVNGVAIGQINGPGVPPNGRQILSFYFYFQN